MTRFEEVTAQLREEPRRWLVTGAAGFIGANLAELLLDLDQEVVGLDNFSTGHRQNLLDIVNATGPRRFRFVEGDVRDLRTCREVCRGVDYVLHQAALGSVPRSIEDPVATNSANVNGFINLLVASRDARVRRFVYAGSSSVYGDDAELPKVESRMGRPLSPYAVSKRAGELYASVFQGCYGLQALGLRYFNVFGPRQDPNGSYAAVIPRWVGNLIAGEPCYIYGDGETSRDFCYIGNVLQANLLAALAATDSVRHETYNVACGERTTLNALFVAIRDAIAEFLPEVRDMQPIYLDFRGGDVRHSEADIRKIQRDLGYTVMYTIRDGLKTAIPWYIANLTRSSERRMGARGGRRPSGAAALEPASFTDPLEPRTESGSFGSALGEGA